MRKSKSTFSQRRREQQEEGGGKNKDHRHVLAILVSRHFGSLSESNKRARERHSVICGQEFVTHPKQQKAYSFPESLASCMSCKRSPS